MSQEQRVLAMLKRKKRWGVKNYEFADAGILRYSARIGELRKTHRISCERLYRNGKATNTFIYRLIETPKPKQSNAINVNGMKYEITDSRKSKWLKKLMRGVR